MGSPEYCYKQYLREYIRINSRLIKRLEERFNDEALENMSLEELEEAAKLFNKSHKMYAAFTAGVAVAHCDETWDHIVDIMNASAGAIGDIMDLIGIYDPDTVDFSDD